jgi:hypothetical protein
MFFLHVIIGFLDNISIIFLGTGIGILAVEQNDRSWLPRGYEHIYNEQKEYSLFSQVIGCLRARDRMVVGFKTTYAISSYHHQRCPFEYHSWPGVLYTTLSVLLEEETGVPGNNHRPVTSH